MNLNKQLQQKIGELIGKDYFKLEFGSKILLDDKYVRPIYQIEYTDEDDIYRVLSESSSVGMLQWTMFKDFEILGTEPTLNDVFIAIIKNNPNYKSNAFYFKGNDGYFEYGTHYDLTKSIFNQTDEVKQALLELVSK